MPGHPADVTDHDKRPDSAALPSADPSDAGSLAGSEKAVPAALFAAIAIVIGVDVALDLFGGIDLGHLLLEGAVFTFAAIGFGYLWIRVLRARGEVGRLRSTLHEARADAARFRNETQALLGGLGAAIDRQFDLWQLSAAEREVGLLLLKGLSLRDVAQARGTSERTVRQQANALYRKANLAGRAELSAFFLEDLLLPDTPQR